MENENAKQVVSKLVIKLLSFLKESNLQHLLIDGSI